MLRRNIISLLTVVSLLLLASCSQRVDSGTAEYSRSLIVAPRAKDVKFSKYKGADQLTYRVDEKFPATKVIGTISKTLEGTGWTPLKNDFFNPDLPSSLVTGWTKFTDSTRTTTEVVHSWAADWKDSSQNIVRYTMQYRYPENGQPNLTQLEVTATYMPEPLAKQGLEAARKLKEQAKTK
jgi:hypothetical protein